MAHPGGPGLLVAAGRPGGQHSHWRDRPKAGGGLRAQLRRALAGRQLPREPGCAGGLLSAPPPEGLRAQRCTLSPVKVASRAARLCEAKAWITAWSRRQALWECGSPRAQE